MLELLTVCLFPSLLKPRVYPTKKKLHVGTLLEGIIDIVNANFIDLTDRKIGCLKGFSDNRCM